MAASLWQILLKLERTDAELTCDECFIVLEYLADRAAGGSDLRRVLPKLREHIARCPHCREHHLRRLRELEADVVT